MHLALHAVLIVSLVLPRLEVSQACDSCSPGESVELCLEHQGIEEEAIRSQQEALASEDAKIRIAALELIAATTAEHSNTPTERVAQVLVEQLNAPGATVQARSAELLIAGQHAPTVLPALIARLKTLDPHINKLTAVAAKLTAKSQKLNPPGGDPNLALKNMSKGIEVLQELVAVGIELHSRRRLRAALTEGLGNLPDDRATQALLDSLAQQDGANYTGGIIRRALLKHGTSFALRGVVTSLRAQEKELIGLRKEYESVKKRRLPKQPKFWKGTKSSWGIRAREDRQRAAEVVAKRLEIYETLATECLDDLAEFGASHDFSAAPQPAPKFASSWRRWADKNSKLLPNAVGTLPG